MKKHSGFAALESLLILIIVGIIGGVGWYAIHTKHQTDKILSQAYKISQSTPAKSAKSSSATPSVQNDSNVNYLVINEWGIKIPLSSVTKDAYYDTSKDGTFYNLRVHSLDSEPQCRTGDLSLADVTKMTPDEYSKAKQSPVGIPDGSRIGNYYYVIFGAQYGCAANESNANIASKARQAFLDVSTKIVAE